MGLLDEKDEQAYRLWSMMYSVPQSSDYDMRGFYMAQRDPVLGPSSEINSNDGRMHFPDTFKLPNHPTFSTGSKYYNQLTMPNTPTWHGGDIGSTGAQSWFLIRPNGEIVERESPIVKSRSVVE